MKYLNIGRNDHNNEEKEFIIQAVRESFNEKTFKNTGFLRNGRVRKREAHYIQNAKSM